MLSEDRAASLLKVATVRNPFDSLVSIYAKRRGARDEIVGSPNHWTKRHGRRTRDARDYEYCRCHTFAQWIRRRTLVPAALALLGQRRPTSNLRYAKGVDVVMRFETLQTDFDGVMEKLGHGGTEIPVVNPTSGRERDYRSYYTKFTRRLIELTFAKDLKEFGYCF